MPVNIVIIYNRAANGSDKYLLSSRCNIDFINIFVCIDHRRHNITCLAAGIYYNIPVSFMQKYHTLCIEQRSRVTLHSTFRFHWIKSVVYAQLHIVVATLVTRTSTYVWVPTNCHSFSPLHNLTAYMNGVVRKHITICTLSTFDNI